MSFRRSHIKSEKALLLGLRRGFVCGKGVGMLLVLVLLGLTGLAQAQPPDTLWTFESRVPLSDWALDVVSTRDGGMVLAIDSQPVTVDSGHAMLIKLDNAGREVWRQTYRRHYMTIVGAVTETTDGGFALVGGHQGQAIFRMDSVGNILWTRDYNIRFAESATDVVQTSDGGFAMITSGSSGYLQDIAVLRLNAVGDTLWTRRYGGGGDDYGRALIQTDDSGFLLAGMLSHHEGHIRLQPFIAKTDSLGNIEWQRLIGTDDDEWTRSMTLTADGGCLITGFHEIYNPTGASYPFAARISPAGDSLWMHTWFEDGPGSFNRCLALPDGGFLLFGTAYSASSYSLAFCLTKIDGDGNREWRRLYDFSRSHEHGQGVCLLPDGSVGIAGYKWNGNTENDAWAARLDPVLLSGYSIPARVITTITLDCYPNPFNARTVITFDVPQAAEVDVHVFDITGRLVRSLAAGMQSAGTHIVSFDGSELPSGMYFVRLHSGEFTATRKVLLLR